MAFNRIELALVAGAHGAAGAIEQHRRVLDAALAQHFAAAVGGTPQPKFGWTDVARFAAVVSAELRQLHSEHSASSGSWRPPVWPACHTTLRPGLAARTWASVSPHRQHAVDGSA